jgi:hypothetical protein
MVVWEPIPSPVNDPRMNVWIESEAAGSAT